MSEEDILAQLGVLAGPEEHSTVRAIAERAVKEIHRLRAIERRAEASTRSDRGATTRNLAVYILTGEKRHWSTR